MLHLPIFDQWREVQRAAMAAELAWYRAEVAHCAGRAAAPEQQVVRSTHLLQAQAHSLFEAAMSEMREAVRALRPARSNWRA